MYVSLFWDYTVNLDIAFSFMRAARHFSLLLSPSHPIFFRAFTLHHEAVQKQRWEKEIEEEEGCKAWKARNIWDGKKKKVGWWWRANGTKKLWWFPRGVGGGTWLGRPSKASVPSQNGTNESVHIHVNGGGGVKGVTPRAPKFTPPSSPKTENWP